MKLNKLLVLGLLSGLMLGACNGKGNNGGTSGGESSSDSSSSEEAHWYDDYVEQGLTYSASFPLSAVKAWYGNDEMEFVEVPDATGYAYVASSSSFIVMAEGDVSESLLALFSDTEKYVVDTETYSICAMVDPVDHTWHLDVYYADEGEDTQCNFLPVCLERTSNTDWTAAEKAIMTEELGYVLPFFAFGADYTVSSAYDYAMYWVNYIMELIEADEETAIFYAEYLGYITEAMLGDGILIQDTYVFDLTDDVENYLVSEGVGFEYSSSSETFVKVNAGVGYEAQFSFSNPGSFFMITKGALATDLEFYDYEDETYTPITSIELEQGGFLSLEILPDALILSVPEYEVSSDTAFEIDESYYDMETYSWMGAIYLDITVCEETEPGEYTITFDVYGHSVVFTITVVEASV